MGSFPVAAKRTDRGQARAFDSGWKDPLVPEVQKLYAVRERCLKRLLAMLYGVNYLLFATPEEHPSEAAIELIHDICHERVHSVLV